MLHSMERFVGSSMPGNEITVQTSLSLSLCGLLDSHSQKWLGTQKLVFPGMGVLDSGCETFKIGMQTSKRPEMPIQTESSHSDQM